MMKTKKQLQRWANNLPLDKRLQLQRFLVKLYSMEIKNDKH